MANFDLTLEGLPIELLTHVLCKLDNPAALLSAIQASRCLHDVFAVTKRIVLSSVLTHHVGIDLIQAALLAVKPSEEAKGDLETALGGSAPKVPLLELDQAVAVAKLDAAVEALAQTFVEVAACKKPTLSHRPPLPTDTEMHRIKRTFYLFEIFRTWFQASCAQYARSRAKVEARKVLEERMDTFFAALPPWEVEQLGCIHDFLFRQIKPG